ncbi:MAG: hypothetical protein MJE12_28565 [Alphaproteobacteria bacterium]|nr:hypothetical protein [Alphaproteobacteria bacterium]
MIKYVCREAKPKARVLRFFFHANWDRLAELSSAYIDASPEKANRLGARFSCILQDICIDTVWKLTFSGRLPLTEGAILHFLAQQKPGERSAPIRLLDLGASDGITSFNLLKAMRHEGLQGIELTIADLSTRLLRYRKGHVTEYRTSYGLPVLVCVGRLGLRLPRTEYVWNLPANLLAAWYVRRRRFRDAMVQDLEISLINPAADHDPETRVIEMNCMDFDESLIGRFDVIRASNILSPRYGFCGSKLQTALLNLHAYLRDGGCLLVSRNDNVTEIERGSTWTKESTGFVHLEDFGGGSEIKEAVNDFSTNAPQPAFPIAASH